MADGATPGRSPRDGGSLVRKGRALAIGEIVAFGVPLAVLPHLTRALGAEGYGRLQTVLALGAFAGLVANPGLSTIATRRAARRPASIARTWARLQPLRAGFALLATAGLAVAGLAAGAGPEGMGFLLLQGAVLLATALGAEPYLAGAGDVGVVGWLRTLSLLVYGAGVFLAVRVPQHVAAALIVLVVAAALSAALSTWRLVARHGAARWAVRPRHARRVVGEGFGYAAASVMSMVYARIDVLLLRAWRGPAEVGVYSACQRLTESLNSALNVVVGTLYPRAVSLSSARPARARAIAQRALRLVLLVLVPAGVGAAAAGGPILSWISGEGYYGADLTLVLLGAVGIAGAVASVVCSFGLTAHGRSRALLAATAAGAAVNVAANLVAIPWLGMVGAAATTLLAQVAVAAVASLLARDRLRLSPWRAAAPWALPSLAMAALVLALRLLAAAPGYALLAAGGAAYAAGVLGLGRLTRSERRALREAARAR